MMNSLWIAKTGMTAQQTQLDVISHNLANVSTTGFKRNNAVFEDLIYQNLRQVGSQTTEENQLPTGLHLGLGVNVVATSRNFTQGSLQQSGNSLDVAIDGNGFFEVQLPTAPPATRATARSSSTRRAEWSPPAVCPWRPASPCRRTPRASASASAAW